MTETAMTITEQRGLVEALVLDDKPLVLWHCTVRYSTVPKDKGYRVKQIIPFEAATDIFWAANTDLTDWAAYSPTYS